MSHTLRMRERAGARVVAIGACALLAAAPSAAVAQDWCDRDDRDEDRHCEVREFTLDASGRLEVDARPNGGIDVTGWDRDEIRVEAKVVSRARSAADARALAGAVDVRRDGVIRAEGPDTHRRESWSVSFRIRVPHGHDLRLRGLNGGISVASVDGTIDVTTTNGGLHLFDLAGDVTARSTNGGLSIELSGARWDGAGLDAETTNGGVTLSIPQGYSARLETGTQNGGFDIDFPVTVSGRIGRSISAELGSGGSPVRVRTTNGGVHVRRAG